MSKEMISAKTLAENWGISVRRVNQLCNADEIEGAIKVGDLWKIPADAPNLNRSIIRNFRLALKNNNKDALQDTLRQYLLQSAGSFDTAQENFYHEMMPGLLAIMSDDYIITSNRESGEGRFDIQLKPVSKIHPGILMEFKASDNADENKLTQFADDAINQIREKQYATV